MDLRTQMEKEISSSYANTSGIVVMKNGKVLYENYYNECSQGTKVHIFSVTKSIISLLIGIAVDKGYIKSLDQKILDFFPEYTVHKDEKTLQQVTLKDLMTMTVPYKYDAEDYRIYETYFANNDWVKAALDLMGGQGNIGEFRYAPLIGTDILAGILVKITGRSVLDFATKQVFLPLGITPPTQLIFQNKEEQLEFYNARDINCWVADQNGVNTAGWGLALTAMDMAKIGQLYASGGKWMNRQIVSESWIKESTKKQSRCDEFNLSYGYLWWLIDEKEQSYAAMGDGGNVIYVNPSKDMVIAIASLFQPNAKDRIGLIKQYIEPAFERV